MNPLSPFAYHRRHKRRALLLMALICLATLGVCLMVRLLDFFFEQTETTERYLTRASAVFPFRGTLDPGVVAQIRAHPDVARVIPKGDLYIGAPLNTSGGFHVFGVSAADAEFLIDAFGLRLKRGRLPRARTNEIILAEEIAAVLELQLGDQIGHLIDEEYYASIPTTMVLVGVLEADSSLRSEPNIRMGLVSFEYLDSHEIYTFRSPNLLVVPKDGRKAAVDRFLETTLDSQLVRVSTQRNMDEAMKPGLLVLRLVFGIVDVFVAAVIALVVGTINRMALTQRMAEFGLLHAVGHGRAWLIRRLTLETAAVAGVGWLAGLALSWLLFAWLKANILAPLFDLDLANLAPIWFATSIPLVVIAFAGWSTVRTFARLDAVAIIDRGELGGEASDRGRAAKRSRTPHSSVRPLSSWTFYRRHSRRGLALAATMALMSVGVAFPAFLFAPLMDVNRIQFEHFRYFSVVLPRMGDSVAPGVMAQIWSRPAVARVVPFIEPYLAVSIPPLVRGNVSLYGVAEGDVPAVVSACGMELVEGHFPDPRANQIVLSRAVAMNRGLHVGDKVGSVVHEDDYGLPTEMVIVGIVSRPGGGLGNDLWLGLASYEYLSSHEAYSSQPSRMLIIPAEGRKAELDAWLEQNVVSDQTTVQTYGTWLDQYRDMTRMLLFIFVAVVGVVAVVAAIALAVLSYIFFSQRQEEFGTLHAIGHSRRWLVRRTVGETVTVVAVAWLIGAVVCLAGLVYMQIGLYAPKGLTLDLFEPGPWLLTLPMPLAVVAVSAGLVIWMLSRLDPVTLIERRS
jgi:ABC-type antimicrobial peptide transport system permease subunit